jgi:uncharacterized protein YndB with AHSA1/START domain
MQVNVPAVVGAVVRAVEAGEQDGKPVRSVIATRDYDTGIEDLWEAVTSAERIPRWFLPVTGELRLGGRYQLQGNAGGTITACEPPRRFAVTWEFGGGMSWVEVELAAEAADRTRLTLRHTAPVDPHWGDYGPGAVGVGWELGLIGLFLHIQSGAAVDPAAFQAWSLSDEGKAFVRACALGWGEAEAAMGEDRATAMARAERTAKFYTGG